MTTINEQEKTSRAPLGQALRDARLQMSLTIEEVAEKLNLAVSTLRDIEDELAEVIEKQKYPNIFLRGYLVNYARLVSLAELKLFPEYQQLSDKQTYLAKLRPSASVAPAKKRGKRVLSFSVLLVALALAFFIVQKNVFSKSPAAQESSVAVISGKITEEAADLPAEEKIIVTRSESELISE